MRGVRVTAKSADSSAGGETPFRWDLVLGAPFLTALALLIINDWILKPTYGNFLTGKLSDFAGLFAFGVFSCAVFPERKRLVLILTAVAFVLWKSELSQPVIDGWNSLAVFPMKRVVDFSDLLALSMLPAAAIYVGRPRTEKNRSKTGVVVAGISLLSFTATQCETGARIDYQDAYRFGVARAVLTDYIDSLSHQTASLQGGPEEPGTYRLAMSIPWGRCRDNVLAILHVWGDTSRSGIGVEEITHWCERKGDDEDLLLQLFQDSVITPLQAFTGGTIER